MRGLGVQPLKSGLRKASILPLGMQLWSMAGLVCTVYYFICNEAMVPASIVLSQP